MGSIWNGIGGLAQGFFNQLGSAAQLPGQYLKNMTANDLEKNTENAASGQPYIPNFNGVTVDPNLENEAPHVSNAAAQPSLASPIVSTDVPPINNSIAPIAPAQTPSPVQTPAQTNGIINPSNPGNPTDQFTGANFNGSQIGTNPALPNGDTSNPRGAQINALTQNLAAGENATPEETQLANEISQQNQGLGDTLANLTKNSGDMGILTGSEAAANQQYGGRINSLTSLLAGLQGQRQLSTQAGEAALGGAENNIPPTQVLNPAQSLVTPFGNTVASGNGAQSVQSLAQQVASGQMSIQQAQSFLPDAALSPQLQEAVSAINPSFNFQQSATNADLQGQVAPAAQNATSQIQNLGNTLSQLPSLENTSVPLVNTFTRLASSLTGVGGGSATSLEAARQDAISAVQGALEQANGLSPTQAGSLADSYFPPGLTQSQFENGLQQFQQQIAGKESAFSNPGADKGYSLPGGAGTLVQVNGKWVVQ